MSDNGRDRGLVIVTGASSGIGAELSRQLSAQGRAVLAVARRAERLEALAAAAREAGHGTIHPLAVDVTDPAAATVIRDRARALGGASWLVNNAGTTRFGAMLEQPPSEIAGLVRLNCESVVALTLAVLPDLLERGAGRLVNVASLAAFQPTPHQSVYGATKAFVLSFSEGLAEELRETGVRVTAVCPGPVTTEIFDVGAPGAARGRGRTEISAEECVRLALAGIARDQVIVIPGVLNRLGTWVVKLAPRSTVRRLAGKIGLRMVGY